MSPATRQRLRLSGGTELSFITAGEPSKLALLLLHGFPSSARTFQKVVPELSQAVYVIVPDLPGFGESDVLPAASFAAFARRSRNCWTGLRSGRAISISTISARPSVSTSPCRRRSRFWASSFRTPTRIERATGRDGPRRRLFGRIQALKMKRQQRRISPSRGPATSISRMFRRKWQNASRRKTGRRTGG